MLFKFLITADASEIGVEAVTGAGLAAVWSIRRMFHVRVLALTRGAPRIDVETFPSREPMLANFLRSSWNKLESFALALVAVVLDSTILQEGFVMEFE